MSDRSFIPDPAQLEHVGEPEEFEPEAGPTTDNRDGNTSGGENTPSNTIVTANYIDQIDKFGMAATMQAERERIADECEHSVKYVHDIHTSDLYREARAHKIAGPALRRLEEETRITKPYPGFDILMISRDEVTMPERCIELKSYSRT